MCAATGHGPTQLVPPAAIWDGVEGDQTSGFEDELRHIEGNIPGRWEYPDVGVVAQDGHGQIWGLADPDAVQLVLE